MEGTKHPNATILENGIKLGGVWRDYYDRTSSIEAENARIVKENEKLLEEKKELVSQHDALLNKFQQEMSSLTREQSSHMAALDILRQARHDKDELEDKFLAVEKDCADKTALIGELQADLESEREAHAFWKTKFSGADGQLEEEKGENAALTEIIDQRDESIDELSNANRDKQAEIEVLQRSLQAKDKQLLSVCRDRDRLKDQLEVAQKALKPVQRRRAAQMTSSSSSSKVLRDRSVNMDASSRPSVGNHSGAYGKSGDKGRGQTAAGKGTQKLQAQAHADEEGGLDMDLSLDDGPFSVRERMLRGVIRRLRQELAAQKPCTF